MLFPPLSLLQEVTSISEPILVSACVAADTIFVFRNHFLQNIGQQLLNLTSAIIMLFVECFSAIFKNIAHALDKQKRPCKAGQSVYIGKKLSTKRRSLFYENAILWENLFSYKQILIFQLNSFIRLELA